MDKLSRRVIENVSLCVILNKINGPMMNIRFLIFLESEVSVDRSFNPNFAEHEHGVLIVYK